MNNEQRKSISDYIVQMRIKAKIQLDRCRELMTDKRKLETEIDGFLDILNELDEMEKELNNDTTYE